MKEVKMAAPITKKVELGFVEKSHKWQLISQVFPSKVGGTPAWLDLQEIPCSSDLLCPVCGKTMVFLLQLYCPFTGEEDCHVSPGVLARCFHRSVYIFCCREPSCYRTTAESPHLNPFVVLRCQLERSNKFYSYDPPDLENEPKEADLISPVKFGVNLCEVCGINAGTKKCGRCSRVAYCCKDHQVLDWKRGHKVQCGKGAETSYEKSSIKGPLFPEYELVTETEENGDGDETEDQRGENSSCEEKEDEHSGVLEEMKSKGGFQEKELESMARGETTDDQQFMAFKKRIASDPDQVLRYQKGGEPLLVSASQQPVEGAIPPCQCGAKRMFEFQVMPQLLTHLEVDSLGDSIDWGTLLIYTCAESCQDGPQYHREFLWKQDFKNESSP